MTERKYMKKYGKADLKTLIDELKVLSFMTGGLATIKDKSTSEKINTRLENQYQINLNRMAYIEACINQRIVGMEMESNREWAL